MDFYTFEQEFDKYLKKTELRLNSIQKENMYKFMNFLLEKNKVMNLTAITDEKEIILKHFIDSIIIQKYIENKYNIY